MDPENSDSLEDSARSPEAGVRCERRTGYARRRGQSPDSSLALHPPHICVLPFENPGCRACRAMLCVYGSPKSLLPSSESQVVRSESLCPPLHINDLPLGVLLPVLRYALSHAHGPRRALAYLLQERMSPSCSSIKGSFSSGPAPTNGTTKLAICTRTFTTSRPATSPPSATSGLVLRARSLAESARDPTPLLTIRQCVALPKDFFL